MSIFFIFDFQKILFKNMFFCGPLVCHIVHRIYIFCRGEMYGLCSVCLLSETHPWGFKSYSHYICWKKTRNDIICTTTGIKVLKSTWVKMTFIVEVGWNNFYFYGIILPSFWNISWLFATKVHWKAKLNICSGGNWLYSLIDIGLHWYSVFFNFCIH